MSTPDSEATNIDIMAEEVAIDVNHIDEVRVRMAYFFPQEGEGPPFIGLAINEGEMVYLSVQEAYNIGNMLLQTVHRAEALDLAVHTHCALTHNSTDKRVKEFRDAFHNLVQRASVPQ